MMDNVVTTLVSTFLIGSSSFFDVTRTTIKAWMGLKFNRIRPGTYELAALSILKNPLSLIMEEMLLPLQFIFD